jgi:hypothetical protein
MDGRACTLAAAGAQMRGGLVSLCIAAMGRRVVRSLLHCPALRTVTSRLARSEQRLAHQVRACKPGFFCDGACMMCVRRRADVATLWLPTRPRIAFLEGEEALHRPSPPTQPQVRARMPCSCNQRPLTTRTGEVCTHQTSCYLPGTVAVDWRPFARHPRTFRSVVARLSPS